MVNLRHSTSLHAIVACAVPDAPVSPGNGQDGAPSPLMEEIDKLEREKSTGKKRGKAKKAMALESLPNKAQPAPEAPAVATDDPDEAFLRAAQATMPDAIARAVQQVLTFEARRPEPDEFFRVHPTQKATVWLVERKFNVRGEGEERFYLVDEAMVRKFIGCKSKVTRYEIRRAISNQDIEFLIPVPIDATLGHAKSMRAYVEKAETTWIKVQSQKTKVVFEEAVNQALVPAYSDVTLAKMIVSAFGEGFIKDENHPIYKAVRGE
jgi:hypothetical protein